MKVTVTVKDRAEADAVRAAMADDETRALVLMMGTLLPLPRGAQRRALAYVQDKLVEDRVVRRG